MSDEVQKVPEGKFIPAFFLPVVEIGQEFKSGERWPHHITLFPPLETTYDPEFGHSMRRQLNRHHPFIVRTAGEAYYGPNNDQPVRLIEDDLRMQGMHYLLEKAIGDISHDETYRSPYNPHISVERHKELPRGVSIFIAGLSIVEKRFGGVWTVVDKIGLKGGVTHE